MFFNTIFNLNSIHSSKLTPWELKKTCQKIIKKQSFKRELTDDFKIYSSNALLKQIYNRKFYRKLINIIGKFEDLIKLS